jgi:hypothetical protein
VESEVDVNVNAAPLDNDTGMLSREHVNKLIGKTRQEATERARRQFEQEQAQRDAERQAQAIGQQTPSMGGMTAVDPEQMKRDIYDRIMSEAQAAQQQAQQDKHRESMQEVAATYHKKMSQGKELHEDFDAVMADFAPSEFPELVFLASQLDNAPSVMYELSSNPMKLAQINSLAKSSPTQATKALKSLSASIHQNQTAATQSAQASAPLSRLKSSVTAGADSNEMSVANFKRQPWLKG